MTKDILVSTMSDDLFSRNWMSLLVVRDWRTRLVSEMNCQANPYVILAQDSLRCDFLLVDLDTLSSNPSLISTLNSQSGFAKKIRIIGIGSRAESRFLNRINPDLFSGYLIKDEIGNAMCWAITFSSDNKNVFTPSTYNLACELGFEHAHENIILKKRIQEGITDRQKDIARMAIIYSIGRRDLVDELKISEQWSYGMVSELYDRFGVADLLSGEDTSQLLLQNDPKITKKLNSIIEDLGEGKKARDLETLAFHLLTMPVIVD